MTASLAPGDATPARCTSLPPADAPTQGTGGTGLVAFVANPTKAGAVALRARATRAIAARGLPEPLWSETTVDDPGVGQTRAAIARGACVVVAVGGDGTARGVAEGLIGTSVPMGIVPLGTGNLLARNLALPLADVDHALQVALSGTGRAIDVGWLRADRDEAAREHLFLVMAGLGFDAALMADTDAGLKARLGWVAYVVAGARLWNSRRLRVEIEVDGGAPVSQLARSIVVGNCGRLPAGITLLPHARLDDGWLDVAAIGRHGGLPGWFELLGGVLLQSIGRGAHQPLGSRGPIEHLRARSLLVRADRIEAVQVDGDVIGRAREITTRIDPGALRVRVA